MLYNKINCNDLKKVNNINNQDLNLKVVNTRIVDLSPNIQRVIKNKKLYEISEPIYIGNNGYTYITCDNKQAKLIKKSQTQVKKEVLNKQFLIFSEKLIKKLNKQANIVNIVNIENIK